MRSPKSQSKSQIQVSLKNPSLKDNSRYAIADFFRIYDSGDTTCHLQGTVTSTSGGGDMELDNTSIAAGQTVTVTTFTLTDGNAFCWACAQREKLDHFLALDARGGSIQSAN